MGKRRDLARKGVGEVVLWVRHFCLLVPPPLPLFWEISRLLSTGE